MHLSPNVVTAAVVVICSLAAAAIDFRTRRVPNGLTGSAAVAGMALALTGFGAVSLVPALVGGLLGLTLMLPGYLFGATGGGDVKLLAAVGTLLGPERIVIAFFVMAVGGGLIALGTAAARRRFRNETFAYAPAIALGCIYAVLK